MLNKDIEAQLNNHYLKDMEGYVFVHFYLDNFQGKSFFLQKRHYMVQNGEVFLIENNNRLTKTNDKLSDLMVKCKKLTKYSDKKQYKTIRKTVDYKTILKIFNARYPKPEYAV